MFLNLPTQTERDYTTRRDFFVFKSKQNRQWKEILQDMQTKFLIRFRKFGKSGKILTTLKIQTSRRVTKSRPVYVGR